MPPTVTRNPFVGPRPILNGEEIFGRDAEIRRLTHLLLAERIVLLHSPSGAGKSSLIQAGFLSAFSRETEDDFYIFPTIRLSVTAGLDDTGPEIFSRAVVHSFEQAETDGRASDDFESLAEYLRSRGKQKANGRCICLVFDQFEECVTFPAGHETAKRAFFADLGNTLADQNIWALFAVREDFLAPIVDLGRVLPTRLKQTFRLDFLSKETAGEVIQKTANLGNYEFSPEALKRLVDDLAIVNVQGADGKFQTVAGEFVEPLHLQVACQYIIQALPEGTTKIEAHHLERTNNGGPRPETNVDEALAAYYRSELSQIAGGDKQKEKDLRFWIEEKLIDVNGVRIPVRQGVRTTEGLENEAIEKLSNAYLARKERRLNATWYELAHDRLVQPILIDNREWFDRNLGSIGKGCRLWLKNKRDPFYLLKGRELKEALKPGSKARTFSADENDFIRESRNLRRAAALRFWGPLVGALVLILLSFWTTWYFYRTKSDLEYYKLFTVLRPLYTAWTPGSADRNILFASHLAKKLGDRKASIDPVLFGDIVTILDRTLDRRQRLLETHWNYRLPPSKDVGNPIPVLAVAYSPDGQTLVAGDQSARMRILHRDVLSDPIPVAGGKIRSVAYSLDGKLVAIGTENGFVSIFGPGDSSQSRAPVQLGFSGSHDRAPEVWSCSWNGQGDLAAGCQDGKIYIWPDLLHASQLTGAQPSVVLDNIGNKPIHTIAWQDTGAVLAAGDAAGHLCLWNREQIFSAPGITNPGPVSVSAGTEAIWSLAWSKDGRLASGSWDHSISIWKIDNLARGLVASQLNRKVQAHDAWVRDVAWINNDQTIVSIGDDGMVKFWKASDLTTDVPSEQVPTPNLWKLSYNPATKLIATANDDGAIRIYQRDPPARNRVYGNGVSTIVRLAFSGSEVLSFDQDGRVYRFDPGSEKEEKTQIASVFQSDIKAVEFHPQIQSFVIGYGLSSQFRGQLAVWDPRQNSTPTFCAIGEAIRAVSCHPTKLIVAFVTRRGRLGLRIVPGLQPVPTQPDLRIVSDRGMANAPGSSERSNIENSRAQNRLTGDVGRIIWSNSGDTLFLPLNGLNGDPNKSQILRFRFDAQSLTELDPLTLSVAAPIVSVQLHPTEPLLAIGTTGGTLILASLVSSQTDSFVAHDRTIESLAWTPDGHRLFSAGADGSIKVWDYDAKGKHKLTLAITLRHDVGGVYATGVSPDGHLYTAGDSPRIFYWPEARYSTQAILDRAKKMINRNMFGPEWALYVESNTDQQGKYEKTFEDLPDLSQSKSD